MSPPRPAFTLNGRVVECVGYSPQTTLLEYLRSQGLTGAKEGCAEGECGACTVILVKPSPSGSEYVPLNSCLMFLPMLAGQEVLTVEALAAGGRLSEVQQAIAESGGSQCGYCTPGFVMSLFAEYYRPGRTGSCDPHSMSGNLCRCTGYQPILKAAQSLGVPPEDDFCSRLRRPAPVVAATDFSNNGQRFVRETSLDACLRLLEQHPEVRVVAGATDLGVESNLQDRRWDLLLSVEAVPELTAFKETDNEIEIGAALTLSELERHWRNAPSILREWFPLFSSPLIRNRATLGGNLATASPIGDAAPLLLALDASLRIASTRGERRIPLGSFFKAYRQTALEAGELIQSIIVPKPFPSLARFFKVAKRRLDDISTVAAAFAMDLDDAGRVTQARLAYGGVAATPIRVYEAEDTLLGRFWSEQSVRAAQARIAQCLRPMSDHRGSAEYRLAIAESLLGKFFAQTCEEILV